MTSIYNNLRKLTALVPLLYALLANPVQAVELGLTPNQVFATWMNINAAIVSLGEVVTDDKQLSKRLAAMEPTVFKGKTPGDVLKQLVIFREKLDQLRLKNGLKATPVFLDPDGGEITPSVVFMNSGYVLDSSVLLLNRLDDTRLIGGFFTRFDISGKTPNGPYSLIELANRRIDALLS